MSKHFESRKQGYENFVIEVSKARDNLIFAFEPTTVENALKETESLFTSYANDQSIKEEDFSSGGPKHILKIIDGVRSYQFTKSKLVHDLDILINDAEKIVEREISSF